MPVTHPYPPCRSRVNLGVAPVTASDPCFGTLEVRHAEYCGEDFRVSFLCAVLPSVNRKPEKMFCRNCSVSGPQAFLRYTSVIGNESR